MSAPILKIGALIIYPFVGLFFNETAQYQFLQSGLFDSAEQKSHMRGGIQQYNAPNAVLIF